MKKVLAVAAVIGLVAAPSLVFANHGTDDPQNTAADVRQEDQQAEPQENANEQANRQENENDNNDANDVMAVTPGTSSPTVQTPTSSTAITEAQARTIAQNEMPGKTIAQVEQETEEGATVFSVRFSDGSRVDVDASTGNIVRSENRNESENEHSGRGHNGDDSDNSHSGRSED